MHGIVVCILRCSKRNQPIRQTSWHPLETNFTNVGHYSKEGNFEDSRYSHEKKLIPIFMLDYCIKKIANSQYAQIPRIFYEVEL